MHTTPLTPSDLSRYFNLTLEEAAVKMNMSTATLKRLCRRHGIRRWPYRKLHAVERRQKILQTGGQLTPSERAVLTNCKEVLEHLRSGPLGTVGQVPILDSVIVQRNTDDTRSFQLRHCLQFNTPPASPVQPDIQLLSPAHRIDEFVRQTVLKLFNPI